MKFLVRELVLNKFISKLVTFSLLFIIPLLLYIRLSASQRCAVFKSRASSLFHYLLWAHNENLVLFITACVVTKVFNNRKVIKIEKVRITVKDSINEKLIHIYIISFGWFVSLRPICAHH
jgi:hypothetical protein